MTDNLAWDAALGDDVVFGFLEKNQPSSRRYNPHLVINRDGDTMLRAIREELKQCIRFSFSVAFVTPAAIALLKQELIDSGNDGKLITSDYLGFNSPRAFAELINLESFGIEARLHQSKAFHPKGYVFEHDNRYTAILGSANLTKTALVKNHEWNIRISAAKGSDLATQLEELLNQQCLESQIITSTWLQDYTDAYIPPSKRAPGLRIEIKTDGHDVTKAPKDTCTDEHESEIHINQQDTLPEKAARSTTLQPNKMQLEALASILEFREKKCDRAIVISATGTGKTILSAFDVKAANPERMLFVVHREQILDKAIEEFQRVLDAPSSDYGKLTGNTKQHDRKYVFATVQTLSKKETLSLFNEDAFDYILIDEVHRAGAKSYEAVFSRLKAKFLLGMTATPERTDGYNIFELFNYNVAYEIRLGQALEEGMLSPFHYYGVAEAALDNGEVVDEKTGIEKLVSRLRINHIVDTLHKYGQAGLQPKGLIFCSRKEEAHALSAELNKETLNGRLIRALALTSEDTTAERELAVEKLEQGELDYILSVDIFNEGVDIPSVNQVVMLRQTQSAIVFIQQLGRGLRKSFNKDYVVVVDFIGNYANNYLIPVALFGDDSLNKESLRKNLIAAEESGVLPGLSSVRFDRIAQKRVLESISKTRMDSMRKIKEALETLEVRLGKAPALYDFLRFESVDPVIMATKKGNYPRLVASTLGIDTGLTDSELSALDMMSVELLAAKRMHELITLKTLLNKGRMTFDEISKAFSTNGIPSSREFVDSTLQSFELDWYTEQEKRKYKNSLIELKAGEISLSRSSLKSYATSENFKRAVDDLVKTGLELNRIRYRPEVPFTAGRQYSRKDSCRLLNWNNNNASTIYGYKVDYEKLSCPIFVTLYKSETITASTAYEDELIDRSTMRWFTRSRRTLASKEVNAIVSNKVDVHVFAKKDDADGSEFYYLGKATAEDAKQTTMPDDNGNKLSVITMNLHFDKPIDSGVFDYFHPSVTD
jgi:superfamily II DNA or RNA helicase/HKD family nuclease